MFASIRQLRPFLIVAAFVLLPLFMLYHLWSQPLSAGEDDVVYYYPLRVMVAEQLSQGHVPLYNTREAGGTGLMADPQSAVLHPATWLFVVLPPRLAYSLSLFAAFSLAGGGAYLYLRRLGLLREACMIGACALMFSGFFLGHRVHLGLILSAAMLPWILWAIEGLRDESWCHPQASLSLGVFSTPKQTTFGGGTGGTRPLTADRRLVAALWLVPILFLAIAAGHWPTVVHMAIIAAIYFLLRARPIVPALGLAAGAAVIAAVLAWPQIQQTSELMAQVGRQKITYSMATENSFHPLSAVLAFFPFLTGSRHPNLYPQQWWGNWNLCEMLGYVGLLTLVLAAGAIAQFVWRRARGASSAQQPDGDATAVTTLPPLVRAWTVLLVFCGLFMLGGYLGIYKYVYQLPVLGVVRCPARMVLGVDMALAVLAAIAVHAVICSAREGAGSAAAVRKGLCRTILILALCLPVVMLAWLGGYFWLRGALPAGLPADAAAALRPGNPAVYVPLALAGLTVLVLAWWLRRPAGGRTWLVAVLLLADLFSVAGFLDVPAPGAAADPGLSPAGQWLARHDPDRSSYRVWGLSDQYNHRPAELLLPKTCEAMGFSTIANYGPMQTRAHAELFGFRIFGSNRNWAELIRTNHLLSLYGVKYILTADERQMKVIESVRVPAQPPPADGPNLAAGAWQLNCAKVLRDGEDMITLQTPRTAWESSAQQPVRLRAGEVYRLELEVRAPQGAGNFLLAEVVYQGSSPGWEWVEPEDMKLVAEADEITGDWRRLGWTMQSPANVPAGTAATLAIRTWSEQPIEIRNVSLRMSHWPEPINLAQRLRPGDQVYKRLQQFDAVRAGDPPVVLYENLLYQPAPAVSWTEASPQAIETVRNLPAGANLQDIKAPRIAATIRNPAASFAATTLPAAALYAIMVVAIISRRRGQARQPPKDGGCRASPPAPASPPASPLARTNGRNAK